MTASMVCGGSQMWPYRKSNQNWQTFKGGRTELGRSTSDQIAQRHPEEIARTIEPLGLTPWTTAIQPDSSKHFAGLGPGRVRSTSRPLLLVMGLPPYLPLVSRRVRKVNGQKAPAAHQITRPAPMCYMQHHYSKPLHFNSQC